MPFIPSNDEWISSHYFDVPQKTIAACGELKGKNVLDVGCGEMLTDFGLLAAGAGEVVGLDLVEPAPGRVDRVCEKLLAHGIQPPRDYARRLTYQGYNGTDFPFADESFDLVFSWGVFEHVADPPRVLAEISRVVKPDGLVLINVYPWYPCFYGSHLSDFIAEPFFHLKRDHTWIRARLEEYVRDHPDLEWLILKHLWSQFTTLNQYTAARFHEAVQTAGFRVLKCELTSYPQDLSALPPEVPLTDAMICGSQLVLGKPAAANGASSKASSRSIVEEKTRNGCLGFETQEVGSKPVEQAPPSCYDEPKRNMPTVAIPFPPLPFRQLVSPIVDDSYYDNPTGDYIWGPLQIGPLNLGQAYERILDFGCGCGREARRLMLQREKPASYVGVDINRGMIEWCQKNLRHNGFSFHHHDVWNPNYAPENSKNRYLPITELGTGFTLIEANSVFTHLHDDQTQFYLQEMRSMLAPNGIIRATWFLFNKKGFPVMAENQNTVFVSEVDTTQAVYYDWRYFVTLTRSMGYRIAKIDWAQMLGFHNIICLAHGDLFPDLGDSVPPGTSVLGY
jgi:SAM-dependent methyltransferase